MNKIIEKIKEFFTSLKKEKKAYLKEATTVVTSPKEEFKQNLNVKENQETIRLQNQYEKEGRAQQLSQLQKIELIQLYAKQIRQLNTEIAIEKVGSYNKSERKA